MPDTDTDTFDWEGGAAGGSVSADRPERSFSPAAGDQDEVEADRDHADEPDDEADDGEVGMTLAPQHRGSFVDNETGKRFLRGETTYVSEQDAERLESQRRRGLPIFVRTDS